MPRNFSARHRRIDVTIRQHDKARAQRRQHLVFEPVDEVGCVEELHRETAERVACLRFLDSASGQHRSRHARVEHRMPARLEPRAEQRDVSGSAHTVSAFDDDQLAAVFFLFDAR